MARPWSLVLLALVACRPASDTDPPQGEAGAGKVAVVEDAGPDVSKILAASDLPEPRDTALPGDPTGTTIHRLDNGLTIYISPDHQRPRFTAWIGVRAGSRMDPARSTGLAHYLEHMLFKGTGELGTTDMKAEQPHVDAIAKLYDDLRGATKPAERKAILAEIDAQTQAMAAYAIPNEFDRVQAALGVDGVNAFTSDEQTVYIGDVPANRLEQWAKVEGERFTDPVYRLFLPELEAVYEEKNLSLDDPYDLVWDTMLGGLFPTHPYGTQTTIGSVEHLKSPAYADMADYFERWYVPNNMAIVLAGDITPQQALPVLRDAFGHLEPKPVPQPEPGVIEPLEQRVAFEVEAEGEPSVRIGWQGVPVGHEDEAVVLVLDRLLDDASVGLLNVELELPQKVLSAGSGYDTRNEGGYVYVYAQARADQDLADVERMLMDVVAKLQAGAFTEADIEAAKLHWSIERKTGWEFSASRASDLMDAFVAHRRWDDVVAREAAVQAVSAKDIVRVSKALMGKGRVVVRKKTGTPELPKLDKPSITPVPIDPTRKSAFVREVEAMQPEPLQPRWAQQGRDYVQTTLPAGELIAVHNDRNDLFSVTFRANRGYRKAPLLCFALELFDVSGRGDSSAAAVQKELYALGSSVWTRCDAERVSLTIQGIDRNFEATVKLVDAWLADPRFGDDLLDAHLANTLSARAEQLGQVPYLTAAIDGYAKYEDASAWLRQPSNETLRKAKARTLRKTIIGAFEQRGSTTYFGPRSAAAVGEFLASEAAPRGGEAKLPDPGGVWIRRFREVKDPEVFFVHKEGAKASVRIAFAGEPLSREQRPLAELYTQYLSGNMSAVVFQEMRESTGLAYSASGWVTRGSKPDDDAALLASLSTQADKTPEALKRFLRLLRTPVIDAARLGEAKAALDLEYRATRINPRWLGATVLAWHELGEPSDPREGTWKALAEVERGAMQTFASQQVDTPVIIAVVGDRARVGIEALEAFGTLHEVQPQTLFSYGPFPRLDR